jgi:carboxylesterase type B
MSRDPRSPVNELADELECPTNSSQALVDCLRQIDAGLLTLKVRDLDFSQSVEAVSENPSEDTCLPDEPLKLLQNGELNPVTSIYGVNSAEYLAFAFGKLPKVSLLGVLTIE